MMYAHCFPEHLAFFADALSRCPAEEASTVVPGQDIVSGHALPTVLQPFAEAHRIRNHRAATTSWSQFFFARLIVPTVVIQHTTMRQLDLSPENWRACCQNDGTVSHFVFDRDPLTKTGATGNLASLIDEVVSPLIAALAVSARLSPRVFAANAAVYFAWAIEQLKPGTPAGTNPYPIARVLLDAPRRPDGGYNPFHAPFKSLPDNALDGHGQPARRCRKICCVRDLDASLRLCANCPRAVTRRANQVRVTHAHC